VADLLSQTFLHVGDQDVDEKGSTVYGNYFGDQCHPNCPHISVKSVEQKVFEHLDRLALGRSSIILVTAL
jgi:hypothetical protein